MGGYYKGAPYLGISKDMIGVLPTNHAVSSCNQLTLHLLLPIVIISLPFVANYTCPTDIKHSGAKVIDHMKVPMQFSDGKI